MRIPTRNFLVDALAFTVFVLLTASGVLMRYVLPPGSGRFTTVWGLDRHEWGSIHFWIAIGLLAALALHLFLHWRWIVYTIKGRRGRATVWTCDLTHGYISINADYRS